MMTALRHLALGLITSLTVLSFGSTSKAQTTSIDLWLMAEWLVEHTNYERPLAPPGFRVATQYWLLSAVVPDRVAEAEMEGVTDWEAWSKETHTLVLGTQIGNEIIIWDRLVNDTAAVKEEFELNYELADVIFHELVHYFQEANGNGLPNECYGYADQEIEAYKLTHEWQEDTGRYVEDVSGNLLYYMAGKMGCSGHRRDQ